MTVMCGVETVSIRIDERAVVMVDSDDYYCYYQGQMLLQMDEPMPNHNVMYVTRLIEVGIGLIESCAVGIAVVDSYCGVVAVVGSYY